MIDLREFAENHEIPKLDNIDEQLYTHYNISLGFNTICVNTNTISNEILTFESIGLFAGCKDIVKFVSDNLTELLKKGEYTIKSKNITALKNKFFDDLYLTFVNINKMKPEEKNKPINKTTNGYYNIGYSQDIKNDNYDALKWNAKEKKFNFIEITINYLSTNEIPELLTHELTHAWDDYILHSKANTSLRNKHVNDNMQNMLNDLKKSLNKDLIFAKLLGNNSDALELSKISSNVDTIKQIIYYLNNFESNAYISQINSIFKHDFENIQQAIDFVSKNSATYHNYKEIYLATTNNEFDNLFKTVSFTDKEIAGFKKKANSIWKKIINHTYHICAEHVRENNIYERYCTNVLFTEQIKKIYDRN